MYEKELRLGIHIYLRSSDFAEEFVCSDQILQLSALIAIQMISDHWKDRKFHLETQLVW